MASRRDELIERATDWVLQHGLVGLSLRPLAAALGTSDRMLIYHLGSKDQLVVEVLRCSTERSMAELHALTPSTSPAQAVLDQWRLRSGEQQSRCERIYVEASTLGLFGEEPYASEVAAMNRQWLDAVRAHLVDSGVPAAAGEQVAALVEAAFMGFELDRPLRDADPAAVTTLAEAVALLSAAG